MQRIIEAIEEKLAHFSSKSQQFVADGLNASREGRYADGALNGVTEEDNDLFSMMIMEEHNRLYQMYLTTLLEIVKSIQASNRPTITDGMKRKGLVGVLIMMQRAVSKDTEIIGQLVTVLNYADILNK